MNLKEQIAGGLNDTYGKCQHVYENGKRCDEKPYKHFFRTLYCKDHYFEAKDLRLSTL